MDFPDGRPQANQVVYRLFDRPIHPEFFATRALYCLQLLNAKLITRITPAGHVLEWYSGCSSFVEMTALRDQELPALGSGIELPFLNARRGKLARHGWLFQVGLQQERVPEEAFDHVHRELLLEGEKPGSLLKIRPQPGSDWPALGLVCIQPLSTGLSVLAYHTYPSERVVLKTQSLIEPTLSRTNA